MCGVLERTNFVSFHFGNMEYVVALEGLVLDHFYFGMVQWSWMILDCLLVWICQITNYRIANCCLVSVCVSVDCLGGQSFWLKLPKANSANAIRLPCRCWHYCLLCTALCIMLLILVCLYVAHIFAYFPHWYTLCDLAYGKYVACQGHICCWNIYDSSLVN